MTVLVMSEPSSMRRPVLDALSRRSQTVRLLASDAHEWSRTSCGWVEPRGSPVIDDDAVIAAASGCDAVIQLTVPTRRTDQGHDTCVDLDRLRRFVEAIARSNVPRLVSLSAGRGAEAVIRGFPDEWMIVRPGLVYGPDDPIIWPLLGIMRGLPAPPRIPNGGRRLQPLCHRDLACVLARSVELEHGAMHRTVRVAGPETVTLQELHDRIRGQLDHSPVQSPITGTHVEAVQQILSAVEDQPHDGEAAANMSRVFGVTPTPFSEGLRELLNERAAQLRLDRTGS